MDVAVASPCDGKLGVCWHQSLQLCGGQWDYTELHQLKPWPTLPLGSCPVSVCKGLPSPRFNGIEEAFPPKCLYL